MGEKNDKDRLAGKRFRGSPSVWLSSLERQQRLCVTQHWENSATVYTLSSQNIGC